MPFHTSIVTRQALRLQVLASCTSNNNSNNSRKNTPSAPTSLGAETNSQQQSSRSWICKAASQQLILQNSSQLIRSKIALDYGTATASAAHTAQPARAQQSAVPAGQLRQQQGDKGCSCKKSKCCTRQCACFKNGKTCGPACKCIACENKDLELIEQAEDSDSVATPSEASVLGDDYSVAESEGLQDYASSEEFMSEDVEEYSEYSEELMEVPLEELLLEEADAAEQT